MEGGARIPRNNQFERITAEPGKGEFVWVKHKQPKPAPSHKDSSAIEMTQQADTHHAESFLLSCPEDGCTKSYMTHGRLGQHLMYGKLYVFMSLCLYFANCNKYCQHIGHVHK